MRPLLAAAVLAGLASPVCAQTAISAYPTGSGVASLPVLSATPLLGSAARTATTSTTSTAAGGGGSGGSASRAPAAGAAPGGGMTAGSSRSGAGGEDWVVCPPSGASGLEPLLTGTVLSCAP